MPALTPDRFLEILLTLNGVEKIDDLPRDRLGRSVRTVQRWKEEGTGWPRSVAFVLEVLEETGYLKTEGERDRIDHARARRLAARIADDVGRLADLL